MFGGFAVHILCFRTTDAKYGNFDIDFGTLSHVFLSAMFPPHAPGAVPTLYHVYRTLIWGVFPSSDGMSHSRLLLFLSFPPLRSRARPDITFIGAGPETHHTVGKVISATPTSGLTISHTVLPPCATRPTPCDVPS